MSWYRTGTVAVTNGSTVVTGTGTMFAANNRAGDAFVGPDGKVYEVTNIPTETTISISPPYPGATASGQTYAIAPMQGYVKASADRLRQATEEYGYKLENIGTLAEQDADDVAITGGTASGITSLGMAGDITFSTSGARIKGDFSNATFANRTLFQNAAANSVTSVGIVPSGTSQNSNVIMFNSSSFSAGYLQAGVTGTEAFIGTGGLTLPISFKVAGVEQISLAANGNTGFGISNPTDHRVAISGRCYASGGFVFPPFLKTTVPSASANNGAGIRVTDAVGGDRPFFSDGTNWRDYARTILS